MSRLHRVLLGIAVLLVATPALALLAPDGLMSLNPFASQSSESVDQGTASLSADTNLLHSELLHGFNDSPDALAAEAADPGVTLQSVVPRALIETTTSIPSTAIASSTTTSPGSTTSSSNKASQTEEPPNPSKPSTTSVPPTTTSSAAVGGGPSTGDITGDVCPCEVTGTATLKGTINLQGDLIVDGGTLIARSGVNVNGNGHQIVFMNGGTADFQGTKVFTWSANGANVNISRDINFRNLRRILFRQGAGRSTLKYFTVSDSGTAGVLGDYPIHWHLNGDTTRGTIVEGVVVVNGANHAFVPHGSHGITFKDTVAMDIRDSAYWWDPVGTNDPPCGGGKVCHGIDNSNDIVFDHVLAHTVRNPGGSNRTAGFVLGAGMRNTIRNSAAINVTGGGRDCSGFHWPEFPGGKGRSQPRVWLFENNYSLSDDCHGIFVWQNSGDLHLIDGFSGGGIDHGAYSNGYHYRNPNVSYMEIHAAGTKVTGGIIDRLIAPRHRSDSTPTFELNGTTVGAFIIDNASNSGDQPGMYVLNGTGLGCGDVQYLDVVPGTEVIIYGVTC